MSDLGQRITLTLASFPVSGADSSDLKALVQKEAKPTEYTSALRVLEGTFVRVDKKDDGAVIAYANPSIRDFALAFLNEEPDYLMAIIEDAKCLAQLSTLLVYAVSKLDGRLRFQHCASMVTRHQFFIAEKIMSLVAQKEEAGKSDPRGPHRIYREILKPLIDTLEPAHSLMREKVGEILTATIELLKGPASDYMDPEDWKSFNEALMVLYAEASQGILSELQWAFESWGELLYTIDNVTEFEEFFELYSPVLCRHFDPSEKFHESVWSGLRQELDNLSGNEQDRDSDHQWVNDVETVAIRVGVIDDMRADIDSARESIEQRYEDDEYYRSQPASGKHYGFPGTFVSVSDRAAIEGMFRELS
ncbi:hypothetical protein ACWGEU_08250 [Streptomyces goshikiensis]